MSGSVSSLWQTMGAGENVGKFCFCLCGPKGSLCCTVLSIWAVVMLVSIDQSDCRMDTGHMIQLSGYKF